MKNLYPYLLIFIVSEQQHKYLCSALELQTINEVTANDQFNGNDRFSGTKTPDRFSTITVVDCIVILVPSTIIYYLLLS